MADLNMSNRAVVVNGGKISPGNYNASKKGIYDELTLVAELAVNDELLMDKIPEGARIINAFVKSDSLGVTGILDLGLKAYVNKAAVTIAEDQDSLVDQADAGGQKVLKNSGLNSVAIGAIVGKGGAQPFLKCTELSTAGTGIKVIAVIEYIID